MAICLLSYAFGERFYASRTCPICLEESAVRAPGNSRKSRQRAYRGILPVKIVRFPVDSRHVAIIIFSANGETVEVVPGDGLDDHGSAKTRYRPCPARNQALCNQCVDVLQDVCRLTLSMVASSVMESLKFPRLSA